MPEKRVIPILNPDKDWSAAHAFDPSRPLSRTAHEALGVEIPWGEHPDDDNFLVEVESGDLNQKDSNDG